MELPVRTIELTLEMPDRDPQAPGTTVEAVFLPPDLFDTPNSVVSDDQNLTDTAQSPDHDQAEPGQPWELFYLKIQQAEPEDSGHELTPEQHRMRILYEIDPEGPVPTWDDVKHTFREKPWNLPLHLRNVDAYARGEDLGSMTTRLRRIIQYGRSAAVGTAIDASSGFVQHHLAKNIFRGDNHRSELGLEKAAEVLFDEGAVEYVNHTVAHRVGEHDYQYVSQLSDILGHLGMLSNKTVGDVTGRHAERLNGLAKLKVADLANGPLMEFVLRTAYNAPLVGIPVHKVYDRTNAVLNDLDAVGVSKLGKKALIAFAYGYLTPES